MPTAERVRALTPPLGTVVETCRSMLDEMVSRRGPIEEINDMVDSLRRGEAIRQVIVFNN